MSLLNMKNTNSINYKNSLLIYDDCRNNIKQFYQLKLLRKSNYFLYLYKMKFEQILIHDIKKKYGENLTIFTGDWNYGGGNKGNAPVKGKSYRRLLDNNFVCYMLDEFNTSMLPHQTKVPCGKCYLNFNNRRRLMYQIRSYTMINGKRGLINRDTNACRNKIKRVKAVLNFRERPLAYRQGTPLLY